MSILIRDPAKLWRNAAPMAALAASTPARQRLVRDMVQANLKRLHRGWSRLANRLLGTAPVTLDLQLGGLTAFSYRPGTTDLLVLEQVFLDGEYDFEPVDPASVEAIVDLGSNIGVTALWWAERFPAARMILVEPDPENFALLERNTAGFRHRCLLVNAAIAATSGTIPFFRSAREYSHSTVKTDDAVAEIQVRAVTLPELMSTAGFSCIDILKMDIEGAETDLMPTLGGLRGAIQYLIAELHRPYTALMFSEHCAEAGLRTLDTALSQIRSNLAFAARPEAVAAPS